MLPFFYILRQQSFLRFFFFGCRNAGAPLLLAPILNGALFLGGSSAALFFFTATKEHDGQGCRMLIYFF
jgi:hypothetical protein